MIALPLEKKQNLAKAAMLVVGLAAVLAVVKDEISSPLLHQTLRRNMALAATDNIYIPPTLDPERQRALSINLGIATDSIYIPPSLDPDRQRALSINLGGGKCKWSPPKYDVPEDMEFHKTFIAGFPSGDKRMVYLQMEALAGYPAKDEWDFAYNGMTNHPFIKGNYPHHEGIWGWGDAADQVVMMVPNIRRSMVEYHDILWDLGYATTYQNATLFSDNLYGDPPDTDDYLEWRDSRVMDEAHWYGWFIDYWMEGGLLRDIFTHQLTTKEHWDDLMKKPFYTREELDYGNYVPAGTTVAPTYDTHCAAGEISGGCEPVAVISADRLRNPGQGRQETAVIASALVNDDRTGQHVIAPQAWNCIWSELIQAKKGPKVITDRPGQSTESNNFSAEMLEEMLSELDRLIGKYGGPEWESKPTAVRLVDILTDHRQQIQTELNQVQNGSRTLTELDFLGPKERARKRRVTGRVTKRKMARTGIVDEDSSTAGASMERLRYFVALEQKRHENRHQRAMRGREKGSEANYSGEGTMTDLEFVQALSNALTRIRSLEATGELDQSAAQELEDAIRKVAREARVVFMKDE